MTSDTVYVVHCIDTEGPLFESLEATFERLTDIFGLEFEPSERTLRKLQREEIDLDGREEDVADVVAPSRIDTHETWTEITAQLDEVTDESFRRRYADPQGNGWVFNSSVLV